SLAHFPPEHARRGGRDLFERWSDRLHASTDAAGAVLGFLHGRAPRTRRAGLAILSAIGPIRSAILQTARFMVFPRDVVREGGTGVQPTRLGREATADSLRANIANKLSEFPNVAAPLLDDLTAAVVYDCEVQ